MDTPAKSPKATSNTPSQQQLDLQIPPQPPSAEVVPDSLAGVGFATWTDAEYGEIHSSGAVKLAESSVAPLVAVARGYQTIERAGLKVVLDANNIRSNSTGGRQLTAAVGDRDALLMPWFRPDDVVSYWGQTGEPKYDVRPSSLQYRPHPANVFVAPDGKKRKYENLAGQQTVMGVHPGIPRAWLTNEVPTILVTEGLLKVDSAVTAYLRHYGATTTDLAVRPGETVLEARDRMADLLAQIPEQHRVLFVSIIGVGTWRQNPEWSTFRLKNNTVWVAFDGDVGSKPQVHKQAVDVFEFVRAKGGTPMLVDLGVEDTKVGIDDYLGTHSWADLLGRITPTLPPRPGDDDDKLLVRMNDALGVMQERTIDPETGMPGPWKTKVAIAGRVKSVDNKQSVTPGEFATGRVDPYLSPQDVDSVCEVEVAWKDLDGEVQTSVIAGPAMLLATKPERWSDPRSRARIHSDVLRLPEWPPTEAQWMRAMKAHRMEETVTRTSWAHMGWVPTDTSPVFLVGNQVIGPNGFDSSLAVCSVTQEDLPNAHSFGVEIPATKEDARRAVRTVLEAYQACWRDKRYASVVIAAGLRPAAPRQTQLPILISGGTSGGKSWTGGAMMGFWQPEGGKWGPKSLPGSAEDTRAATEVAISKTPIWVMDDLAPSAGDPMTQQRARTAMAQTIRSVSNSASKLRRTADMMAQDVHVPRALVVFTAEAAFEDASIMNRLIHIQVEPNRYLVEDRAPTNRVNAMLAKTNEPAMVTGWALSVLAREASKSWTDLYARWDGEFQMIKDLTATAIEGRAGAKKGFDPTRHAETIADLSLGLVVLRTVLVDLDLMGEYAEMLTGMMRDIVDVASEGYAESRQSDTGIVTLERIRSLLASGRANVVGADVAGAPVVASEEYPNANALNQKLGWTLTGDKDRPAVANGTKIGVLIYDRQNVPVVLLDPGAAFAEIQAKFGRDGHSAKSTWDALWRSGLCHTGWRRRSTEGGRSQRHTVRVTANGTTYEGVPVALSTIALTHETEDDQ